MQKTESGKEKPNAERSHPPIKGVPKKRELRPKTRKCTQLMAQQTAVSPQLLFCKNSRTEKGKSKKNKKNAIMVPPHSPHFPFIITLFVAIQALLGWEREPVGSECRNKQCSYIPRSLDRMRVGMYSGAGGDPGENLSLKKEEDGEQGIVARPMENIRPRKSVKKDIRM